MGEATHTHSNNSAVWIAPRDGLAVTALTNKPGCEADLACD